jgi:hypothetical protein
MYAYTQCVYNIHLFHNKSNEITSLWPVLIEMYIWNRINYSYIYVVSSRRNKTNPYHRNKFIPVLNATHLQAFKPKLSTYDQLLKINQQDVSFNRCVCVSWNIFNRIHFFATCDVVWFMQFVRLLYDIVIYDDLKSRRSSFDKLLFFHHIQFISYC